MTVSFKEQFQHDKKKKKKSNLLPGAIEPLFPLQTTQENSHNTWVKLR